MENQDSKAKAVGQNKLSSSINISLRILATTNNTIGDLFTRLMKDLFFALGYDDLHLNVHKPGRELDIMGHHRLEPRKVVAECKAHAKKMGGEELNKFFGVLTRERRKTSRIPIAGYFISLSGFTETGIEQEKETAEDGIILLDAEKIISELERSHVIIGLERAAERAGQCAHHCRIIDADMDIAELVGHERGYIWAIYYSRNKEKTHFALIHADGTPLAEAIAHEIIEADKQCSGILHTLKYLAPEAPPPEHAAITDKAIALYKKWLGDECGFIQLDGLPADADLSATRLKLERLFIPLKAYFLFERKSEEKEREHKILPISEMLGEGIHLALLSAPGGGKSTLLKRLAVAYAFPERRADVADNLPEYNWLPIFIRCRELKDKAYRPILEILGDLPRHACMTEAEASAFLESTHEALRAGRALLLVDGLDEISEEGARQVFANHLRAFLAVFPKAAIVVTSREAGFRVVAGVVASACLRAKLAPFEIDDVIRLCELWHLQVIAENEKVRIEAQKLARTIWGNERIRTLAENPLLLTTLLVVKRWIGELPRNRAALYREAIRVLIRTWNVEGYAPLDEEETLAQLSFVACAMMENGTQQIGHQALSRLLQQSRQELEPELHFVRVSPTEFIQRIEYRSSLLMQIGHDIIDGELQPVYEFRHLTFQEYLAARGYVEEQFPGRSNSKDLLNLLEPHFKDERWLEVVALSAVLAGRKAEQLIKKLATICESFDWTGKHQRIEKGRPQVALLIQCLLDEVQVTSPTLQAALLQIARHAGAHFAKDIQPGISSIARYIRIPTIRYIVRLRHGKFGDVLQQLIDDAFLSGSSNWYEFANAECDLALEYYFHGFRQVEITDALAKSLLEIIEKGERIEKVRATLVCMELAFLTHPTSYLIDFSKKSDIRFQYLRDAICKMLDPSDPPLALAASWALAWIGESIQCILSIQPASILTLYRIWRGALSQELSRFAAWALAAQPLLPRNTFSKHDWGICNVFLRQALRTTIEAKIAAFVVAWYRHEPWNDSELAEKVSATLGPNNRFAITIELLDSLGDTGKRLLREWKKKRNA